MVSLEELLAEDGFRGRRSVASSSRSSFRQEAISVRRHSFRDQNKTASPSSSKINTERARSNLPRYIFRNELPRSASLDGTRPRDNLMRREKPDSRSLREHPERLGGRLSTTIVEEVRRLSVNSSATLERNEVIEVGAEESGRAKNLYTDEVISSAKRERNSNQRNEIIEVGAEESGRAKNLYTDEVISSAKRERNSNQRNEIIEIGAQESDRVKHVYSDSVKNRERREKYSKEIVETERCKSKPGKDTKLDKRYSKGDVNRRSLNQPGASPDRSSRGSVNRKSFKDYNQKHHSAVPPTLEPALDEVASRAVVSIICGYIKRFLKDEDFRACLRHNCFSSLNLVELEEGNPTECKVIAGLDQAIETVERAAEEAASVRELKKASLQLSVITGLSSSDLKDGFTSGVANSVLSACGHLYLSVIYKIQKKDRVSAKHLLHVFCDSPFLARTTLLPELWEDLILPHLAHLKVWYNQEVDSLDARSKPRKLKLIEKVYNETMDSGTYQFAVYYKDWLTEGIETPSVPSIQIPSVSVHGLRQKGSLGHSSDVSSPASAFSPQPMVSKKLYDAVFGRLSKPSVDEAKDDGETENFDYCTRSSGGSTVEKQTLTYSSEIVNSYQDIEEGLADSAQDNVFHSEDALLFTAEGEWKSPGECVSPERDIRDNVSIRSMSQKTETLKLCSPPDEKTNEFILNGLAKSVFEQNLLTKSGTKSVFEQQQTEGSSDLTISCLPRTSEAPLNLRPSFQYLRESDEHFNEGSFFASIPQDFICPLTGKFFEDPVTLETGQTFEREAIKEWIDQGNRTCPVTGKTLEYPALPLTNFVLNRLIDGWKSANSKQLLAFASHIVNSSCGHGSTNGHETATFILEQLLTVFSSVERITNAKHLISLGGLQFLIHRFELGKLEEKARVAALMCCCIEADAGCRNQIARSINIHSLLELLHSKRIKPRTNAVFLLTELICLSRQHDVSTLLGDVHNEELVNAMHVLLVYLQSSPPEQRPLVSVLTLHLDLLVDCPEHSLHREAAVDAITMALEESLTDEKIREKCCRALLILGGIFSFSGKLVTETWILKLAGFDDGCEVKSVNNEKKSLLIDDPIPLDDEASEERLQKLSSSLLGNGKGSFLDTLSKILGSGNLDLVGACLTTVAWLSQVLSAQSDAELQLSVFSALVSRLKEILANGKQIQQKVLASMSLLNFSKIPECRVLLMVISEEIKAPLQSLADVTWTAKQLNGIISGVDL